MRPVVRYQADDGSLWLAAEEAEERDAEIRMVAELYETIGMKNGPAFRCGYVQQPEGTRVALLRFVQEHLKADTTDGPVRKVAQRLWRIDGEDREWPTSTEAFEPEARREVGHV